MSRGILAGMSLLFVIVGIFAGLAVAGVLFKPFFGDIERFMDSFKTDDGVRGINPEMGGRFEDGVAISKVALWLALVAGAAVGVWYGLVKLFA